MLAPNWLYVSFVGTVLMIKESKWQGLLLQTVAWNKVTTQALKFPSYSADNLICIFCAFYKS